MWAARGKVELKTWATELQLMPQFRGEKVSWSDGWLDGWTFCLLKMEVYCWLWFWETKAPECDSLCHCFHLIALYSEPPSKSVHTLTRVMFVCPSRHPAVCIYFVQHYPVYTLFKYKDDFSLVWHLAATPNKARIWPVIHQELIRFWVRLRIKMFRECPHSMMMRMMMS